MSWEANGTLFGLTIIFTLNAVVISFLIQELTGKDKVFYILPVQLLNAFVIFAAVSSCKIKQPEVIETDFRLTKVIYATDKCYYMKELK